MERGSDKAVTKKLEWQKLERRYRIFLKKILIACGIAIDGYGNFW
jgi:hypothetical protein